MPFIKVSKCKNCGISHEWFFDGMDLQELRMIKRLTGMRAAEFGQAADEMDPDALAAMFFILHKRDGIVVPFDDINVDFSSLDIEPTEDELREEKELEARMQAEAERGQLPKIS